VAFNSGERLRTWSMSGGVDPGGKKREWRSKKEVKIS